MGVELIDEKYEIVRKLGEGGMGAVYEARHQGTARRVALKLIASESLVKDKDSLARFQREARASGSIESQHVVQVLDTGVDPATKNPYMVMELLGGEDLLGLVGRLGALPPSLVLRIIAQSCVGLQCAHDVGIVHRDVKSANLFLSTREGGERVVKVLDFGIAKVKADQLSASQDHGLTRTGAMLGSPLYMSPEQARGEKTLDKRSDIFSLGVVMYEALCGMTPNGNCETLGQLILAICSQETKPIQDRAPWVRPEIARIVHMALMQDPRDRFQTAAEMHAAIKAVEPDIRVEDGMLVGITPELRAQTAARHVPAPKYPSRAPPSPFAATAAPPANSHRAIGQTTGGAGGVAAVDVPTPERSSSLRWVALPLALLVLGGIGAGGFELSKRLKPPAPAPLAAEGSAAPSASIAADPPALSASAAAPAREERVTIDAPPGAKVFVDNEPAELRDGQIQIRGAIGTVHAVRIKVGDRETTTEVAITDKGPRPPSIVASARVGGAGPNRPLAPAGGGGAGRAAAPAPRPPAGGNAGAQPAAKPTPANPSQPSGDPPISPNL